MALPATINSASPLGGSSPSLGDNELRDLKLYLADVFGVPDNVAVTAAPMSFTAGGLLSVIQSPLAVPTMIQTRQSHMLQINAVYTGVQMLVASNLIGSFTRTGLAMNVQFVEWASGQTGVIGTQGTQPVIIRTNSSPISEHSQTGLLMRTQFVEWASGQTAVLGTVSTQPLLLRSNSLARWIVDGSGMLLASTDNVVDIGASGASRPRNLFVGNNVTVGGNFNLSGSLGTNLNLNNNNLNNLASGTVAAPSLNFSGDTDTGFYRPSANVGAVAAGGVDAARFLTAANGVNFVQMTPAATAVAPAFEAEGSDTNVGLILGSKGTGDLTIRAPGFGSLVLRTNAVDRMTINATSLAIGTNLALVPAVVGAGTPVQHGLFRENVVKGWVRAGVAGDITDSFNVASLTDNGIGTVTVTWDRDFANSTYVVAATLEAPAPDRITTVTTFSVGSVAVLAGDSAGTSTDPSSYNICGIGDQ